MHLWDRWTDRVHVVVADGVSSRRAETASAIAERDAWTATTATSVTAVVQKLSDDHDPHDERAVDCVVTSETVRDGTGLEVLQAVRDRNPDLPVILYPETADGRKASEATAAGVTDYLPREIDDDYSTLRTRIDAGVEQYRQRWDRRETVSMFQSLMENIPETIYFKDTDGRHVCVSTWAQSETTTDLLGKTDLETHDDCGEVMQRAYEDDLRVASTGQSIIDREKQAVFGDERTWYRTSKFPWRTETGDVTGLFGITREVTEQKERERKLEQRNRQLEEFVSFVSSDLRNPLSVATGYLDLARETGDERAFEKVREALDRMERLIDDRCSMNRNEQHALSTTWIELRTLVEQTWTGIDTDGTSLQCDVTPGTTVKANGEQLCRLLETLFRNVVEHTDRDVTVTVGVTATGFYVEDDGPGIDIETLDTAFERDTIDSDSGTDSGSRSGSDLDPGPGLEILADIAEAHGWERSVTDGATGGTRFEFDGCLLVTNELETATPGETHALSGYRDIGNATPSGEYEHDDAEETWTIHGGGRDIWRNIDEHAFVYTPVSGDVRIVCRLTELEWVHEYSKAGIMIRGSDAAGSPLFFTGMTPRDEAETASRADEQTTITCQQFPDRGDVPHWFRIDRVGEQVTSYTSANGDDWDVLDQAAFRATDAVTAGLAVCSHNPDVRCTAAFSDVRVRTLQSESCSNN